MIVPSQGRSGGLWLIWSDEIKVTVMDSCINWIAAEVEWKGSDLWLLIGVYGDPNRVSNPEIWAHLDRIMGECDKDVALIGDFNALASVNEKWGGRVDLSPENIAFRSWIS